MPELDLITLNLVPNLDYQQVITRDDLNMEMYEKKFQAWDMVMEQRLIEQGNPHAITLLDDLTIYTYAFLRLSLQRIKLYPYQDLIVNDKHRFIYFLAANQIGKSLSLDVMAVFRLLTGRAVNIAIVSKSLDQSKFQMSRIRQILNESRFSWKEETGESESIRLITMDVKDKDGKTSIGVNRLICAPCTEGLL